MDTPSNYEIDEAYVALNQDILFIHGKLREKGYLISRKYYDWQRLRLLILGIFDPLSNLSILNIDIVTHIFRNFIIIPDKNLEWWYSFKIGNEIYFSLELFCIRVLRN